MLAKAVGNQSRINVQIANSQMQNQRRNTIFQDTISRGRHIQSMQLSGTINNNIANIVDFNNAECYYPCCKKSTKMYPHRGIFVLFFICLCSLCNG